MTTEEFKEIAKQIPPSHPSTEWSFRSECIKGKYLLYDGKKNKCICTNCGHEFDIAPGEYSHMHGLKDICPCCEAEAICLSAGRGRRQCQERHRLLTFASDGKSLWMVVNDILVSFDDFAMAQIYRDIIEVFKINAEEQKHWRFMDGWFSYPPYWTEIKSFNTKPLPSGLYYPSKVQMHIFREDIEEIVANSDCRYLMGKDFMEMMNWTQITSWIALQMKYPALELLRKGGFPNLAKNRINGNNYEGAINIRAKTIEKALRLPKKYVKVLRKTGIGEKLTPRMLKAFQLVNEQNKEAALKNWQAFEKLMSAYRSTEYCMIIAKYSPLDKYMMYMSTQATQDPTIYTDYLKNAAALGWDLDRKNILYPADLMEAHDRAADLREMEKNAEIDKKISANAVDIDFKTDDLRIICAKSQGDLNKESRILHHCVRTYGEKVAEGRTLIYFIRKAEEIKIPFYTLEIDPKTGRVIQCRGERNKDMTPEVKEFRDGFEKVFKKMIKKGVITCQRA